MITGDHKRVAQAIAEHVQDDVIAGVLPGEKGRSREVDSNWGQGCIVDGINDAPALVAADLGIAMGSGTDIAIESGGIVLVKNDLRDVVTALPYSQKTFARIKLNLFGRSYTAMPSAFLLLLGCLSGRGFRSAQNSLRLAMAGWLGFRRHEFAAAQSNSRHVGLWVL